MGPFNYSIVTRSNDLVWLSGAAAGRSRAASLRASLGAVFLPASAILLFTGATTAGTVLALIVVALALVNLVFHFCAGCFLFLQIARFRGQPRAAS